jgi:diguanylate cyclase (GGDEF)-like protein
MLIDHITKIYFAINGGFVLQNQKEIFTDNNYSDVLTGLPNRYLFHDRLTQALALATRNKHNLAVLFMSVDSLKLINDSLGQNFGDQLLKTISNRLKNCLRDSDTVARPGRDEFMILLPEITYAEDAEIVAIKIISSLDSPFTVDKNEFFITTSIGISIYPSDGGDSITLIKNSYTAMQHAKEIEKNTYQFYSKEMNERAFERMMMGNSLRLALKREEFLLHYQPQVDLSTGTITGMEALVRWQRPGIGILYPNDFIQFMEETGLIVPLGEWVLNSACTQNKMWQKAGLKPLRMAVNLSTRQFHQQNITEVVSRVLKKTNLEPDFLELELTESIFMRKLDYTVRALKILRSMGIRISIDDFGTGYSSLCYLKYFPFDKLKIVTPFIPSVTIDHGDLVIARAIVEIAHSLNMKVTAEGVEKEEHLELVRSLKCDELQGNIFSHPLTSKEATKLLVEGKSF